MPGRLISAIVGVIGALWLGIAGAWAIHWWDTRPAGEPTWANLHFLWFHWSPPESLGAQLADADTRLAVAIKDVSALEGAVAQQDAAEQAVAARGTAALAQAEQAVRSLRAGSAGVSTRLVVLGRPIAGDDVCARVKSFDATFTGTLR